MVAIENTPSGIAIKLAVSVILALAVGYIVHLTGISSGVGTLISGGIAGALFVFLLSKKGKKSDIR